MEKRRFSDNRGVATLFTVIVSTIIMTFCLALLLVSYGLYTSSLKSRNREKCRALSISLTKELKESLTSVSFDDKVSEDRAKASGEDNLWFYLRDNLNESTWPSYKSGSTNGNHETSDRIFDIESNGVLDGGNVTVTMYWTNDESDEDDEEIYLYVRVESTMGAQKYSLTSRFLLDADESYDDGSGEKWIWQYEGRGEADE
jgi:hypothetical protein